MPRFIWCARLFLAVVVAGLGMCALSLTSDGSGAIASSSGGTALPPGWELCLVQGIGAPLTQANVANLDEWQAVEGGSTNNSAAYNPFNTRRMTDVNSNAIPGTVSSNGFPAFPSWVEGCAATVATILQPNMWSITAALRAGNVAPPGAFLADVDKSQWCAPSADGTPCYADKIVGATAVLPAALIVSSAALSVYGNVKSDVSEYQRAVAASAVDQGAVSSRNQELLAAQSEVSATQSSLGVAEQALKRFAIDEYVSSGLYVSSSFPNPSASSTPFGALSANGVAAQQYERVAASDLLARDRAAAAAVTAALSYQNAATKAFAQASSTLTSDTATENLALARLVSDVTTLQTAGACTAVQLSLPAPVAAAPASPANETTTTQPATTGHPTAPTTTTPTTSTTSTTTTTTTVPPTTVPSTTTTTTTTTVPQTPSTQAPATPAPAGLGALQGCIAVFTPTA